LSHQPDLPGPEWPFVDKAGHLVAYAIFGWLLARATHRSGANRNWVLAVGLLYAASDEVHQAFVPGRVPSWGDLAADIVGLVLAFFLTLNTVRNGPGDTDRPLPSPGD
jgi:VanZ family protein